MKCPLCALNKPDDKVPHMTELIQLVKTVQSINDRSKIIIDYAIHFTCPICQFKGTLDKRTDVQL